MDPAIPYTNIHSHIATAADEISIYNAPDNFTENSNRFISIGLHPWNIDTINVSDRIELIRKCASAKNVLAIGECGLDKLIHTDLKIQEELFKQQILIAETVKKPMIIHCVKSFDTLIRIKKEMKVTVPMIIHGYNNNKQIAEQLSANNFYFSFGKALLKTGSNASKILPGIPEDKLFFETDDEDIPVKSIFEKAAGHRQTDVLQLKEIVYNNFKHIFSHE
jgi:TatD DNase family protein